MNKLQQGFTLIELMIVVAIIGILAAIAVPAYQDYTIKSKVSEAASLMSATKTAIEVAYSEGFELTALPGRASLGLSGSSSYIGKFVSNVNYDQTSGQITATMSATEMSLPTSVRGATVVWTPTANQGGSISWAVSASSGVPTKYLPKN
jgi:type IV pilus assembly protein PilA